MRAFLPITLASLLLPAALWAQLPLADVGNLTATAMLGWYAWHTVSHTIPQLVEHFRAELATERSEHRAALARLCDEIAAERDQRQCDAVMTTDALQDLRDVISQRL